MSNLLTLSVGKARITVDEDLCVQWYGKFDIHIAVQTLTTLEDLLCLNEICRRLDPTGTGQSGWRKSSTNVYTTNLLENRIARIISRNVLRERVHLLIADRKGVLLEVDPSHTSLQYGYLYKAFDQFLGCDPNSSNSEIVHLWSAHITPQGIPYDYENCSSGGMYRFWNFSVDNQRLEDAIVWARHSFDVVSAKRTTVELIDWTPPNPFRIADRPNWIQFS
jgi:hypothetical protein